MFPALARPLTGLALAHAVVFLVFCGWQLNHAHGQILSDGNPIGGDFVNLWTVGRMVMEGLSAEIYVPERFMELQQDRIGAYIGHRLWAYPPHSLAVAIPFGVPVYFVSLAMWSLLGLAVLGFGARRAGLNRWTTAFLLASPASLFCIYWGQTGNLACGLLLLALSQRNGRDIVAVGASTLLTVKPQLGVLLPVLWLAKRQWGIVVSVTLAVAAALTCAAAVGGLDLWEAYLFETLPELNRLERYGSGPFVSMIPSTFMALRIVTSNGDLAAKLHLVSAAAVLAWLVRTFRHEGRMQTCKAIVPIATAVITPYLHVYDLTLVLAGTMMITGPRTAARDGMTPWNRRAVLAAWALPYVTLVLNKAGFPIAPAVMLALLVFAVYGTHRQMRIRSA